MPRPRRNYSGAGAAGTNGSGRSVYDHVAIADRIDREGFESGALELGPNLLGAVGSVQRVFEVFAEDVGLVLGVLCDQIAGDFCAGRSKQVHDEDRSRVCGEFFDGLPESMGFDQVVEEAVGDDCTEAVFENWQAGQISPLKEDPLFEAFTLVGETAFLEHGFRAIDTDDSAPGVTAGDATGYVARAAAEVEDMLGVERGKGLGQQSNEGVVGLREIGSRVGPRLDGIEHEFGLWRPFHRSAFKHGSSLAGKRRGSSLRVRD